MAGAPAIHGHYTYIAGSVSIVKRRIQSMHTFVFTSVTMIPFHFVVITDCRNLSFLLLLFLGGTESLGTAATTGLLYHPEIIGDGDCREIAGMKIGREDRSTRRTPTPAPLCPQQNSTSLDPGLNPRRRGGKPATNSFSLARPCRNLNGIMLRGGPSFITFLPSFMEVIHTVQTSKRGHRRRHVSWWCHKPTSLLEVARANSLECRSRTVAGS
jgi:hypothetical protein